MITNSYGKINLIFLIDRLFLSLTPNPDQWYFDLHRRIHYSHPVKPKRTIRVAQLLKEELARLISREQSLDQALVTLTEVDLSPDFKQARIYFSSLNKSLHPDQVTDLLNRHARAWQQELGKRVRLKTIPRFSFECDQTLERGDRVLQILRELDEPDPR